MPNHSSDQLINRLSLLIIYIIFCTNYLSANVSQGSNSSYVIYCPCMGRFGNQAEQLLGSLLFAKSLGRTLVLPPFINYGINHDPELIPFQDIIQVDPIKDYQDVILLSDFMSHYANYVWPQGERRFYCYSARSNQNCDPLRGQPFNTFWTSFNITEDKTVFYRPLSTRFDQAEAWKKQYPASSHPVLTFVGAPSPFPTHKAAIAIQKHIKLSPLVLKGALEFRKINNFLHKPYLSMHIRHGPDWKKACELLKNHDNLTQLFSSNQCTGYPTENSPLKDILHYDTCLPSLETISRKLSTLIQKFKRDRNIDLEIVHLATDFEDLHLWSQLELRFPFIRFIRTPSNSKTMISTLIDISLMASSDIFIGNCISSFSAFPARIRTEQLNISENYYFGQDFHQTNVHSRDEL